MEINNREYLALIFGILGNIISFLVFLAPVPTFCNIVRKKSSAGYPSLPYIIGLFSASLMLYYGILKKNVWLLITINAYGGAIELMYIFIYILYAPKRTKIITAGLILLVEIGFLGAILVFSMFFADGKKRVIVIGWICAVINVVVFASPLCNLVNVYKTKSVEFMPIALSLFLSTNAAVWFFYGFFLRDPFIAVPNVLGVLLGIVQLIFYLIYRNAKPEDKERGNVEEDETPANNIEGEKVHPEQGVEIGIIKKFVNMNLCFIFI